MNPERFTLTNAVRNGPRRILQLIALTSLLSASVGATRLFTCGFEENDLSGSGPGVLWSLVSASPTTSTTNCKSGTYCMEIDSNAERAIRNFDSNLTSGTIFYSMDFRITTAGAATGSIYAQRNSTPTVAQSLTLTPAGVLSFVNDVTGGSITGPTLSTGTYYRIETKTVLSDTAGSLELKVDGVSYGTLTSVDTLNTNLASFAVGTMTASGLAPVLWTYDNIRVNDAAGSAPFNDWLGVGYIDLFKPASDVSTGFTKTGANCSGTTNADCVDDHPGADDGDSGYNEVTGGLEAIDQFAVTSLPAGVPSDADIVAIHLFARARGTSSAGTNTARLKLWDEGSNLTDGPTTANFCDNTAYPAPHRLDTMLVFDAGTRTKANINSFNIGYETVSLAQTCRFTVLTGNVEWKEAPAGVARRRVVVTP